MARGGTLFLDEIGELKPELQAKLLRALEARVFDGWAAARLFPWRPGSLPPPSRNLLEEVRSGRFRMDLYRLRTMPFYLPPLRERPQDIPLLVNHHLARLNRKVPRGKEVRGVDPKVMALFQQYPLAGQCPGTGARAGARLCFRQGRGDYQGPPARAGLYPPAPGRSRPDPGSGPGGDERLSIQKALKKAQGNREAAARLLSGISRSSLWRKMKAHGLF